MRLMLKDFQDTAVQQLMDEAGLAANEARKSKLQVIVFSAPTGSGKTVVATALMERILGGDSENAPDAEATFLWLTDQPELNEQTRRKLLAGSTVFDEDSLITVEAATFKQRAFDAGRVYFLNTQKLGKNSSLTSYGEDRQYTIWDTIRHTVEERPGSFWLVIDEAHRGMQENGKAADATTLVQKLIKGSEADNVPSVPLVLGISATPDRFTKLLAGTQRTNRSVSVKPEDVRSSGLLKETITLFHTDEKQPSDITLLQAAAARVKQYDDAWEGYSQREQAPEVRPVLVVQVQDGTKTTLTKTDLGDALKAVESALGPLSADQVAHCFQEGGAVQADDRAIKYIAPSDIEDDPDIRVVFFKMALTTGWDCPRAEVMMSFRTAQDDTLIAQLVGRMVRTPLARSVGGDELLESVSLYLPYYDRAALDEVIGKLSEPDPDNGLPGAKVVEGNKLATLKRAPAVKTVFDGLSSLPMYKAEKVSRKSALRRYIALGRELAWDGLEDKKTVKETYNQHCVEKLKEEYERLKDTPEFKEHFEEAGRIDVRAVRVKTGATETEHEELTKLPVLPANIEHAYDAVGRTLGGGLHAAYVMARFQDSQTPLPDLKRELFALLHDPTVLANLEQEAETLFNAAYNQHKAEIADLGEERRQKYRTLRQQSVAPPEEEWTAPHSIEVTKGKLVLDKHLFAGADGKYHADKLNALEQKVLTEELARADVLGWLRNFDRKPWAFSLVYKREGEYRTMYPDFLVFREEGGKIVADIIDPHTQSLADAVAKARGLAEFAEKHSDSFGRIELIDEVDGVVKRIPLHEFDTRKRVLEVQTEAHLRDIFKSC